MSNIQEEKKNQEKHKVEYNAFFYRVLVFVRAPFSQITLRGLENTLVELSVFKTKTGKKNKNIFLNLIPLE